MVLNTNTTIYGITPTLATNKRVSSSIKKTYGLSYPLTNNISAGWFSKESGLALVRNNLKQLLSTNRGERVMLPGFGLNMRKYLFQPMDEELFESIKQDILSTINNYANNVRVLKLGVFPLDDYGVEGYQALKIVLSVQLKDSEDTVFEVGVKIG
jgi:phage baseplate assembly protein W